MAHGDDHEHDENCDHDHSAEGDGEELDPASPRGQLNELLNGAVEVAVELLAENGEFDPFALALRTDGEVLHLGSDGGETPSPDGEGPDPDAVIASLRTSLMERKAELIAIAIVADVTLEDEESQATTAAIAITMEHVVEEPVSCFLPYEIDEKNEVGLADLVGEPGERHVFPAPVPN
jgi:hypothetical protein